MPSLGRLSKYSMHRLLLLTGILLAEYILLSLTYDVQDLAHSSDWAHWRGIGQWMAWIVVSSCLVLFGQVASLQPLLREAKGGTRWPGWGGHILAYGSLFTMTPWVLASPSLLRVAIWLGLLGASVISLVEAVLSLKLVVVWLRQWTLAGLRFGVCGGLIVGGGIYLGLKFSELGWEVLSEMTLWSSAALLRGQGELTIDPENYLLGLDGFVVRVSSTCSGIEGLGLVSTIVPAYIVYNRRHWGSVLVWGMVPAALIGMFCSNSVRIALLVWIGARFDPGVALGGFHSKAGWLLFCSVVAGTLSITWRCFSRSAGASPKGLGGVASLAKLSEAPYLFPLMLAQLSALVAGMFVSDFPVTQPGVVGVSLLILGWSAVALKPKLTVIVPSDMSPVHFGLMTVGGGFGVYILWQLLIPESDPQHVETMQAALWSMSSAGAWVWIVSRVVGSVVTAPLIEELAFRGYLMRRWGCVDFAERRYSEVSWMGLVVSSTAFAALHSAFFAAWVAGFLYGLIARSSNHLRVPILAHAVTNALIALDVLVLGRWSLWF